MLPNSGSAARKYNIERQVLGKRKDSFIEEVGNLGEKVDSCLKPTPPPHPASF